MRVRKKASAIIGLVCIGTFLFCCNKTALKYNTALNAEVEMQVNNRINYFIGLYGSKEKLEAAARKSISQIKEEIRPGVEEQVVVMERARNSN